MQKILSSVTQTNKLVSPILESSSHLSPSQRYSYTKKQIKSTLNDNRTSFYVEKIRPLLVQGSFLKLLHLENSDSDWLSFVYSLPWGYMSFVLRSFIDCLPSMAALKRMKKKGILFFVLTVTTTTLYITS